MFYGYGIMLPTNSGIYLIMGFLIWVVLSSLMILIIKKRAEAKNRIINRFYWLCCIIISLVMSLIITFILF
jgi:hypothetical protein